MKNFKKASSFLSLLNSDVPDFLWYPVGSYFKVFIQDREYYSYSLYRTVEWAKMYNGIVTDENNKILFDFNS